MLSSTIAPSTSKTAVADPLDGITLFDEPANAPLDADDSGVLSDAQAQALLTALQESVPAETTRPDAEPAALEISPTPESEIDFDLSLDPCEIDLIPPETVRPAPTMSGRPMPELPPKGEIAALGARRQTAAPKRIGSGRLVPVRLTWKPRDPLSGTTASPSSHFRWDTMLTTACITAACGIGCIWLLRSILT